MPKVSGATGRGRAARASKKTSSARGAGNPKRPPAKPTAKAVKKIDTPKSKPQTCAKTQTDKKCLPCKTRDRRGTPKAKGTVKTKGGGKIGNPPFEATPEQRIQVEAYVAAGAQQWLIAEYLGISEDTLHRHFKIELEHGRARVDAKIGSSIVQKALAGESEYVRFYAARRGGWSEKHRLAVGGDGDAPPIKHEVSPAWDLSGLSREELKEMKRLAQKARSSASPTED